MWCGVATFTQANESCVTGVKIEIYPRKGEWEWGRSQEVWDLRDLQKETTVLSTGQGQLC